MTRASGQRAMVPDQDLEADEDFHHGNASRDG